MPRNVIYDIGIMTLPLDIGGSAHKTSKKEINAVEILMQYKALGYVFHGSTSSTLVEIEPRTARDEISTNEVNNDTAIFASVDPAASVIFACMSKTNIPPEIFNGSWEVRSNEKGIIVAKLPKKWEPYIVQNVGTVYVLNGESFKGEGGWQVKSKHTIKPTDLINVTFHDFELLGGLVVWE